jgi:hypothetical protein
MASNSQFGAPIGGAWWKQLSDFLHYRTDNRLRRLQIRAVGSHVSVQALAPCDGVRALAEAAVREIVPAHMLAMLIKVEGETKSPAMSAAPTLPADGKTSPAPELFAGDTMFRRVQRLVNGN